MHRCGAPCLKISVLLFVRLILAAGLSPPNCSVREGTTCVGHTIGTLSQGVNIQEVLDELHEQFCGCTHITGSIQIDLSTMEVDPPTLTEDDFNFLYFVEEVSGVLRFQNISTVARIVLPSLIIIRGDEQVPTSEGDRLVLIVRNTEIGELIMPQLREISDGDVLFENTGELCNYKTINWVDILNNGELVEFTACDVLTGALPDCSACDDNFCWSPLHCQTLSKVPCGECGLDRCYLAGGTSLQCCNPLCSAGCFGSHSNQCFACKDFNNNGTCVSQCPPEVVYDPDLLQVVPNPDFRLASGDLCVDVCPEGLFKLSGNCLLRCPTDFFSNAEGECIRCNGPCPRECAGLMLGQNVDSTTIEQFRDCTIVASGGLYISVAQFTFSHDNLEVLSTIQEIRGPLDIENWDGTSFPYLRNLRVVGAENSTRNLPCSGVPTDFSLIIAFNADLMEIDFSSLEEIRGGGYAWFNNPQLCFTGNYSNYLVDLGETQCVSSPTPPRRDGEVCIADGFICHEQCSLEFSCWGRNDTQCDGCRTFEYQDRCVQNCSFVELASDNSGLFQNEATMVCEDCDRQCLGGCTGGVSPENCNDCRNYFINMTTGRLCVDVCPLGTYQIPSTQECAPCFEACVGGCTGPLPYVNVTHGCLQCSHVELDRNGKQVNCLRKGCEIGTYPDILVDPIGDLPAESEVCWPCDELCEACIGPGTTLTVCSVCTYAARLEEGCVRECDPITEYFLAADRFCLHCALACSGCDGPSTSDCLQCATNFTKEFSDVDVNGTCIENRFCSNDMTEDISRGTYQWQETVGGSMHQPLSCMYGDSGMAVRNCTEEGIWEVPDLSQCVTIFEDIASTEITRENVEDVTQITSNIAEAISDVEEEQTAENLEVVINVIIDTTNITDRDTTITGQTTENVVMIVDAVQDWSDVVIEEQSSLIVQTFEEFASQLVQQEDFSNITVIAEETLLQAQSVSTEGLQVSGITLLISSTVFNEQVDDVVVNITQADDIVGGLPPQQIVSVVLPSTLFIQIMQGANNTQNASDGIDFTGIVFTLYERAVLFPIATDPIEETFIEIGTPVVGVDIAGLDVINLTEPFKILLRLNNASSENPSCVSYDFNALGAGIGNWTTEGCTTVRLSPDVVECNCDHLTNFGVLVDISDRTGDDNVLSPAAKTALNAISVIGSIFSLIGCALTVIAQLGFKKLRNRDISKFHAQLSIAIFGMMIAFVVGIEQTQSIGGCVTVSLLVHYFSMASVMWMAAEAWLMFQKVVIVFVQITTRYIVIVSLICWLIPIPFVVVPVAVDHNLVINEDYCFISNIGVFFGAYFGPVLALMVFNTIIFITVIVVWIKQIRRRGPRKGSSTVKTTVQTLINIIGIMSIFGLTWLFGAFTVTQKTQLAFLILFVLFSSFQGFFIFVFLCVVNKDARKLWIQFFTQCHGRCNKIADSSKYLHISRGKLTLPQSSTPNSTASTAFKYSSDQYSTQSSSQRYDDCNVEMCHTTTKAVFLNEGALDSIDTEVSTNT